MTFNTAEQDWLVLDEVDSTQRVAADYVRRGDSSVSIVLAHHQNAGRGRFDRVWMSERDSSLTVSLIFHAYPFHARPWLIGMAVAVAAAQALDCKVQWPNDLLLQGKKLGGILTEIVPGPKASRIAVVGLGINLREGAFPTELMEQATSLVTDDPPETILKRMLTNLCQLEMPETWSDLAEAWNNRDATRGKTYRLDRGTLATAVGIGSEGQLIAEIDGKHKEVYAADAIFASKAEAILGA